MAWLHAPGRAAAGLRICLSGWLGLALLWAASRALVQLPPWAWLLALVGLAAPAAWGLWLAFMLRKRVLLAQFSSRGVAVQLLSGGSWAAVKAVVLALLLGAAALWQGGFLAPWEWALLALAPPLHAALAPWLQHRLAPQFAEPAFAWRWSQALARAVVLALLGSTWVAWMAHGGLAGRDLVPAMDPQTLDAALARIQAAPSGLVRWGLDALLALQVGSGAALALPGSQVLRLALLALTGPAGMLLFLGWQLQGASATRSLRAALRPPGAQARAPAGARAAVVGLVCVLATLVLLQAVATADALARVHASPLALRRLPACERIGERFYTPGTLQELQRLALQALAQSRATPALCTGLQPAHEALQAAIERYLDWYFSLGAEWGRIAHMLTGGAEGFLQEHLAHTLEQASGLGPWMTAVQQQVRQGQASLDTAQARIAEVLERHHLTLDAGRCLVGAQAPADIPAVHALGGTRQRLAASAAGGGAAGLAAAIAAKAAAKGSMKAAAKVLAKAAAKQGLAKAGGAGAGALAGAAVGSVLPGAGTALGAAAGALIGLGSGVAIDWALLRAEERLTREDMRQQLREALAGQLDALGQALACGPG